MVFARSLLSLVTRPIGCSELASAPSGLASPTPSWDWLRKSLRRWICRKPKTAIQTQDTFPVLFLGSVPRQDGVVYLCCFVAGRNGMRQRKDPYDVALLIDRELGPPVHRATPLKTGVRLASEVAGCRERCPQRNLDVRTIPSKIVTTRKKMTLRTQSMVNAGTMVPGWRGGFSYPVSIEQDQNGGGWRGAPQPLLSCSAPPEGPLPS